jgi:hypothetical protein
MKTFEQGELELAMILSIHQSIIKRGGSLPEIVIEGFIKRLGGRLSSYLVQLADDTLHAPRPTQENPTESGDDDGSDDNEETEDAEESDDEEETEVIRL